VECDAILFENFPTKFQRVMDNTLKQYFDWLTVYIDDILVFSNFIEQHFKHLIIFLQAIKNDGLFVSKKKMELFKNTIKFLANGHLTLQQHGVKFAENFRNKIVDKK
jgi:hypothetical protein